MNHVQKSRPRTCNELGVCNARANCDCTPDYYFAPGARASSSQGISRKERLARFVLILAIFMALGFSTAMALGRIVWGGWAI